MSMREIRVGVRDGLARWRRTRSLNRIEKVDPHTLAPSHRRISDDAPPNHECSGDSGNSRERLWRS